MSQLAKQIKEYKERNSLDHMVIHDIYISDEVYQQELPYLYEFGPNVRHDEIEAGCILSIDKFKMTNGNKFGKPLVLVNDGWVAFIST